MATTHTMTVGNHRAAEPRSATTAQAATSTDRPSPWLVMIYPFSFALTVAGIVLLS